MAARTRKLGSAVLLGALVVAGINVASVAGSLEPPGPPAPTMKTLEEAEPRTPIATVPFFITEPGSYYLTEDIQAVDSGIYLLSDHVTLDLMGHRLSGGSSIGIEATGVSDVVIRNGTVSGWGVFGIDIGGSRIRIEKIRAVDNANTGIRVGDYATVDRCLATGNNGNGIKVGNHGVITESTASENDDTGIFAGDHARIAACKASSNGGAGIGAGVGSIVRDSIVSASELSGIVVYSNSYVLNNSCRGNGVTAAPPSPGIWVIGSGSRVDGNHLVGNGRGVSLSATGNSFVRNSLFENLEPDDLGSGNQIGPYVSADDATNPWSNLIVP